MTDNRSPLPAVWIEYDECRWRCPACARFLAESAIRSWDVIDPGEFYGVRGVIVADCPSCGEVDDPQYLPVRTRWQRIETDHPETGGNRA